MTRHKVIHFPDGSFAIPTLPVTREALLLHVDSLGPEHVEEVAAWAGIDFARTKPRRSSQRIGEAQRLFEEHVELREIALRMQLSLQTVRKYVSEPKQNGSTMRCKSAPTMRKGGSQYPTLPAAWNTPRKRALGTRIVRLHDDGLGPMAIADRLGKSDAVVRRYLRETASPPP